LLRPAIHALLVAGLAGLGWGVQILLNHPHGDPWAGHVGEAHFLGAWSWAPTAAGCVGLALCAVGGFVAARGRTAWLPALLVLPGLGLAFAATGYAIDVRQVMADFGDQSLRQNGYQEFAGWLAGRFHFAQALLLRGALWAWLGYAGAALAAGCVPVARRKGKDAARWAWPLVACGTALASLAVYALGYGVVFYRLRHLRDLGVWDDVYRVAELVTTEALPYQAPLLVSLAVLVGLTLLLLPLRPRVEELGEPPVRDLAHARATAGIGLLGAGTFVGLAYWLAMSARALSAAHVALAATSAETKQTLLVFWGYFSPYRAYYSGAPVALALVLVAAVIAAPLLLTSVRSWRAWVVPATLFACAALAFLGVRATATSAVTGDVHPHCEAECTEFDRIGAMLLLAPLQNSSQVIRDRCSFDVLVEEREDLKLPRSLADDCPEIGMQVQIRQGEILVNSAPVNPVDESRRGVLDCDDSQYMDRLRQRLHSTSDDARHLAARNPNQPFKGRLLVAADQSTPSALLDCVLTVAFEAGFHEPHVLVARPTPRYPLLVRTVQQHADPALVPPDGAPVWSLHLSPDQAVLTSPAGETWTAPTAADLADAAHAALATQRGSPMLWVHRSEDFLLQDDLDARAVLTAPGLFVEAWSPPLGHVDVWSPPVKPVHPAVP